MRSDSSAELAGPIGVGDLGRPEIPEWSDPAAVLGLDEAEGCRVYARGSSAQSHPRIFVRGA